MYNATSIVNENCEPPARARTPCCPDCGALECLCRPRFFAGQLLSEQDLNRLDQYIKNKNRLHNRSLHGWGVVNGLLVVCDPCGEVTVTQGYAVDPCGDDIVVCKDTAVNICELIRQCKKQQRLPDCDRFLRPPNTSCDDIEEVWVLTIKYKEWPSRGVTALRGNTCRTSCCGETGSGKDCTCSCHESRNSGPQYTQDLVKKREAPPECEPTVICEGFSFAVYKNPDKTAEQQEDDDRLFKLEGAFWEAFNCCAQPLVATYPPMPDLAGEDLVAIGNSVAQWCCRFRENLLNYFSTHRNTSCEIIDFIRAVNCPNVMSPGSFVNDMIVSYFQLLAAWFEGLKNCFCLSLMPPPPQATCDTRVPLATVRIRVRDCKILSICNWTTERKIMVTWPAVSYWLGIVQVEDLIREVLERLCCPSLLTLFDELLGKYTKKDASAFAAGETVAAEAPQEKVTFAHTMNLASGAISSKFDLGLGPKMKTFAELAGSITARGYQPLDLGAVLNAVSPRFKLPDNGKPLSNIEAKNLPVLLMSEVFVKPVLSAIVGEKEAGERVKDFQRGIGGKAKPAGRAAGGAETSAALQKQLNELRAQLDKQGKQIKVLREKLKK